MKVADIITEPFVPVFVTSSRNRTFAYMRLFSSCLLALAIIVMCTCCIGYDRLPAYPRESIEQTLTSVAIETKCHSDIEEDNDLYTVDWKGSGVIIDARHVLTAHHVVWCLGGFADIHVQLVNGKRLRMVLDRQSETFDLALLEIASADSFGDVHPPVIGDLRLTDGLCAATAYPTRGWLCGFVKTQFDRKCQHSQRDPLMVYCYDFAYDGVVFHGNSGSPVYNRAGELVGIVTAGDFFQNPFTGAMTNIPKGVGYLTSLWQPQHSVLP